MYIYVYIVLVSVDNNLRTYNIKVYYVGIDYKYNETKIHFNIIWDENCVAGYKLSFLNSITLFCQKIEK